MRVFSSSPANSVRESIFLLPVRKLTPFVHDFPGFRRLVTFVVFTIYGVFAAAIRPRLVGRLHVVCARPPRLRGVVCRVTQVSRAPEPGYEIRNTIALDADLASLVRAAVADDRFPLVLAGNCNSAVGTTAAIDASSAPSGSTPTPTSTCLTQARRLAASDLHVVDPAALERGELGPALESAGRSADAVYLHIDLDNLDPSAGKAKEYAAPGGLTRTELSDVLAMIAGLGRPVAAAALTAYDPECDPERRVARAAVSIAAEIVERFA